MTFASANPTTTLLRLINGYQVSQALHVAASLKFADFIGNESRDAATIAAAAGTHPAATYRLLRALASVGVFVETEDGRFASNELSDLLRSDREVSLRGWAAFIGRPYYWQCWGDLINSVRTGQDAPRNLHGKTTWEVRAGLPDENAIFNAAMASLSGGSIAAIVEAYDFGRFEHIVDVGGGDGTLLSAILKAYPGPKGTVFDLPHVVSEADLVLSREGLRERVELQAGDFLRDAVTDGADAYVLKSVLHDWNDIDSQAILQNVAKEMRPHASLLVIEGIVTAPNGNPLTAFSDLNMLVANGGRERSQDEWERLLGASGFKLDAVVPTRSRFFVLEAHST